MDRLIGQMEAKRGIAAALVHPYLDRVCIVGSIGTGKTTVLEAILDYFSEEKKVTIPANVTAERLLGEREVTLLTESKIDYVPQSLLYPAKIVISDQFALMTKSSQTMLVQLLKNKELPVYKHASLSTYPLLAKWFYCLHQEEQDRSNLKHARLCVRMSPVFELSDRSRISKFLGEGTGEYSKGVIQEAKHRLPHVRVPERMLRLAIEIVIRSGCKNQEADIDLVETARALAALDFCESIEQRHIEEAAEYVVSHRMGEHQESPTSEDSSSTTDEERFTADLQERNNQTADEETKTVDSDKESHARTDKHPSKESFPNEQVDSDGMDEEVERMIASLNVQAELLFTKNKRNPYNLNGKHQESRSVGGNGRTIRIISRQSESLSLHHTLVAAAPFMKVRTPRQGMKWAIEKEDMRFKWKSKREGFTILFLVDASRSIAVKQRMKVVKGAIMELLRQAYQKRDRIGLVTFRKTEAVEILPFTNNFSEAKKRLEEIATGGKTPLAAGLQQALRICVKEKRLNKQSVPYVVIVTDGNANETVLPGGTAAQARNEAYRIARSIANEHIPVSVIDTQSGRNRFGLAEELANALHGEYISLDILTEKNITEVVQNKR